MYIPKRYGQSRINNCPFCGKISITKNKQGVPVCLEHKTENLNNLKCVCGEYLDIFEGKWGPYFRCMNCGNINFKKGLEMNPQIKNRVNSEQSNGGSTDNSNGKGNQDSSKRQEKAPRKEITVTSDQIDYMY
jgi:hypothetical protein